MRVLQQVFRQAAVGTLEIHHDPFGTILWGTQAKVRAGDLEGLADWRAWYDYFSVPQPLAQVVGQHASALSDLGKAIASLDGYVQACRWFSCSARRCSTRTAAFSTG